MLGCSSRKTQTEGTTPAICRYDGPFYQDFRSHLRERIWPALLDVAVLSAKFGFIGALTEIEYYDHRMDHARAVELAPSLGGQIDRWLEDYDHIRLCLGKDYLAALPMDRLDDSGRAEVFEGPIGVKRQKLGAYLQTFDSAPRLGVHPSPSDRLSYFLPDWDDLLDPDFDFMTDTFSAPKRERQELHCAHLLHPDKIADGILVSLAQKRESKGPLKYVGGLDSRTLRPINLRQHYGLDPTQGLFGDCGAFSYVNEDKPPFSIDYVVSLYDLYNFDYGASIDHIPVPQIIVDGAKCDLSPSKREARVALTVDNADAFLREVERRRAGFVPVGTVQGLSPEQYAHNACAYAEMGYRRIALGGLVPLPDSMVQAIVTTTMEALKSLKHHPEVHLFGIFRPKLQHLFRQLGITSFDSASYFRKAWLRSDQNYLGEDGNWYAAIRVPMTSDGRTRTRLLKAGADLELLEMLEAKALSALHEYDRGRLSYQATLSTVLDYDGKLARSSEESDILRAGYERTLQVKPWRACRCPICMKTGIDVMIFRGSNRNKRRGAHNTWRLYGIIKERTFQPALRAEGGSP